MSNKKYRLVEFTGDKVGDKWYVIEKYRKFLWWSWWSVVYEDTVYDTSYPLYFKELDEAKDKLKELENEYTRKIIA